MYDRWVLSLPGFRDIYTSKPSSTEVLQPTTDFTISTMAVDVWRRVQPIFYGWQAKGAGVCDTPLGIRENWIRQEYIAWLKTVIKKNAKSSQTFRRAWVLKLSVRMALVGFDLFQQATHQGVPEYSKLTWFEWFAPVKPCNTPDRD